MPGLKNIVGLPKVVDPRGLIDGRSGKPRRVPKKIARAIDLLLTGECTTTKAAAARVGSSEAYFYKALRQPHIRAHIDERTRGSIDHAKPIAAARLIGLINGASEHVSLDASRHVLSIGDIRPAEDARAPLVNVNITPGYVVKLKYVDAEEAVEIKNEP